MNHKIIFSADYVKLAKGGVSGGELNGEFQFEDERTKQELDELPLTVIGTMCVEFINTKKIHAKKAIIRLRFAIQ